MARVKGVVAQLASRIVVLNADDPLVLAMAHGRDPQTIALVGCDPVAGSCIGIRFGVSCGVGSGSSALWRLPSL